MTPSDTFHPLLEPAVQAPPEEPALNWEEPVPLQRRPSVKCPRCLTVNTADDPECVSCHAPLGDNPRSVRSVDGGRRAARFGLVCLAIGIGLGPVAGNGIVLLGPPNGGPTVNTIMWALLGGVTGMIAGCGIGWVKPRRN